MKVIILTHVLAVIAGLVAVTVVASPQCATGVNTGGGNCVPPDADGMPGYNPYGEQSAPPVPQPAWADSWGSIAIDDDTGQAGTITGRRSREDAERAALHDCGLKGASGCKIVMTYRNQCAAVAWGKAGGRVARNPTENGAQDDAMEECKRNMNGCRVVYSGCSVAKRLQ
ncbi:protein of unknown function [Luteibacter sp. UNC138MFCol5.1]|nr:protein of unknown function [Luteibacter sp. UNC138MFCol5.1]